MRSKGCPNPFARVARVPDPSDFDWHPEPDLIDIRDPERARKALEALGEAGWTTALDWLYEEAMRRPVGPDTYPEMRLQFFGEIGEPAPAHAAPRTSAEVLEEFRTRVAPYLYNAQHPRSFSYFTPPPLALSIVGEVLSQWVNQGVDIWHA